MSNKYYVIPDLHGRKDLLDLALMKLKYLQPDGGTIVFLGDYIDRGYDSIGCVKSVMNPMENWKHIALKGNHEDMFVGYCEGTNSLHDSSVIKNLDATEIEFYAKWMDSLPVFHIIGPNIFAHAFYDPIRKPEEQNHSNCIWQRMSDYEGFYHQDGFHLTHGHTPRKNGPILSPNRTNLDCGAVFYDRLVIGVYDETIPGPIDFIDITK